MQLESLTSRVRSFLGSRLFFGLVLGWFVFESAWIALTAIYPMAFDEDFHFGLIQLYAQHLSPFLQSQPAHADQFGAVARDPSYLYHYLMSFPYRFLTLWTHNQMIIVIILRFINIALLGGALVLFRRLMLHGGLSRAFTHVALAIFTLIPIVPLVAGEINYDNLMILLVAWLSLLVARSLTLLRDKKLSVTTLLTILIVCLLGSLVKYAFLPFFAVAAMFVVIATWLTFKHNWRQLGAKLNSSWQSTGFVRKLILGVLVLLSLALFAQRYGVNVVRYHTIIPNCGQVLDVQSCSQYGPWHRNYTYAQHKSGSFEPSLPYFTANWWGGVWKRLYFTINGNVPFERYQNSPPLPVPFITSMIVAVISIVAIVASLRRIWRNRLLLFLLLMCVVYLGALFYENYNGYTYTGRVVAANGRYLLPILPILAILAGRPLQRLTARWQWQRTVVALVLLLCFLDGGGVLEFIMQSNNGWYWPNHTVQAVNNGAQAVLKPVITGSPD